MPKTSLLDTMRERSLSMPDSLKAVSDFLLMEGSGVESLSMVQIAQVTYTSKPTLVRFAKRLGYSGWPEFRRDFLKAAQQADAHAERLARVNVNYPFGREASYAEAAQATLRVSDLASEAVASHLNDETLLRAALMLDARRVAFFGRPPSTHLGGLFATRLNTFGKACWVPHAEEAGVANLLLGEDDCAIFSSYSGVLAAEPLCYAQDLKRVGTKIIAITANGSQLARMADLALTYEPLERYFDKMTFLYSSACTGLWLDALFSAFFRHHIESFKAGRQSIAAPLEESTSFSKVYGL